MTEENTEPKIPKKTILKVRTRLLSEANTHEHWRNKYDRNKVNCQSVKRVWYSIKPKIKIPCLVTLIRSGSRLMDFDNLVYSFKGIRDCVGSLIRPDLAPGRADGEGTGIEWAYKQVEGPYWIFIEIEEKG